MITKKKKTDIIDERIDKMIDCRNMHHVACPSREMFLSYFLDDESTMNKQHDDQFHLTILLKKVEITLDLGKNLY